MKHSIIIIQVFIVAAIFTSTSCTKFLQETPKSNMPASEYYQTTEQALSALNYLYDKGTGIPSFYSVRGGLYDASNSFTFDNMSGLANNVVAQNTSIRNFASLTQGPDNCANYLGGIWRNFYSSIADANSIIANVENNGNINAEAQKKILATAKFFRAANYYYLIRLFGAVPLILKPYTSLDNIYMPRTSVDSVYNSITEDLNWALTNGMLADVPMGFNGNNISRGTVQVMLSEVYLTMAGYPLQKGVEYYKKALNTAKELLNSGGGYALFTSSGRLTPFDKLRLSDYDKGSEYLFFIEYDPSIQQSPFPQYSFPNTFPSPIPSTNLKIQYSLVLSTWTPSTQLLKMYDSANDIRRHEKQFYSTSFVYKSTASSDDTAISFSAMPYRWYDSAALFMTGASGKYTAIYRMADAYLIAAEAANELGEDPTPYLQPIIHRAYINMPAIPGDAAGRKNFILAERCRELAMEGHFWFDMLRTRLYPDVSGTNPTFSALIGHSNGRGQFYTTKDLLLPLPPTEMQRNPNLQPQNPMYE
ncbi:RagB/SusD family nutrient uptake outer membrane protein [Danxiaibacter flavus]|uniref:RagB/SusD family nutrient uptake outer membrane protein n=1 Tax=Danxiaibacter flavus TaxID=3049108 RepID=A0ABV3ZFU6_9BACT|nr:RagB/SusD family nutrient uptake outer membrane protein [Chitinophagaceae bacterium DXS]